MLFFKNTQTLPCWCMGPGLLTKDCVTFFVELKCTKIKIAFGFFFFLPSSGISPCGWTNWAVASPPTLGGALLYSSWASSDIGLDPEFDHPFYIVHHDGVTTIGVEIRCSRLSNRLLFEFGLKGSSRIWTHDLLIMGRTHCHLSYHASVFCRVLCDIFCCRWQAIWHHYSIYNLDVTQTNFLSVIKARTIIFLLKICLFSNYGMNKACIIFQDLKKFQIK